MRRNLWPRSGISGAAVRLVGLLGGASALVLVTSVPIGLLTHGSLNRAVSLGFYIFGAFLVVIGLAGGTRGPFRSAPEDHATVRLGRQLRRATLEELNETINTAAVVVVIGVVLLVIGVAIDGRYTLF